MRPGGDPACGGVGLKLLEGSRGLPSVPLQGTVNFRERLVPAGFLFQPSGAAALPKHKEQEAARSGPACPCTSSVPRRPLCRQRCSHLGTAITHSGKFQSLLQTLPPTVIAWAKFCENNKITKDKAVSLEWAIKPVFLFFFCSFIRLFYGTATLFFSVPWYFKTLLLVCQLLIMLPLSAAPVLPVGPCHSTPLTLGLPEKHLTMNIPTLDTSVGSPGVMYEGQPTLALFLSPQTNPKTLPSSIHSKDLQQARRKRCRERR